MSKSEISSAEQKFLSETDKLILKLDTIITSIRGKEGPIDYKSIKDGFDKTRFKVNEKLKEAETLMGQRDKILTSTLPNEIYERKKLEGKIEDLLEEIDKGMKDLDIELTAQKKKKGKYGEFTNKDEIKNLMQQKYQLLRGKLDGIEIDVKEIEENRTQMEQLESILSSKERTIEPEREIYEEEQNQIDEWKQRVEKQDEDLNEVHNYVKQIKKELNNVNQNMEDVHKKVKGVSSHTDQTNVKVETQNKKLKDLLEKLRGGDKICVDILLFLVILGLAAVLYSIIKKKFS